VPALLVAMVTWAKVIVSDVDPAIRELAREQGFHWATPKRFLARRPTSWCPRGSAGCSAPETVARLEVPLIVGPANNQLTEDSVADLLASAASCGCPTS
jgi:hypothetical protein